MDFNDLDNRHKRVLLYYSLTPSIISSLVNTQNDDEDIVIDENIIDKAMSSALVLINKLNADKINLMVSDIEYLRCRKSDDELNKSPIRCLGLSNEVSYRLYSADILSIEELTAKSESDLKKIKFFGSKGIKELKERLKHFNLKLKAAAKSKSSGASMQ